MAADAMTKISYGFYVLATKDGNGAPKGCIVNTLSQATVTPEKVLITVNKQNYTHDVLLAGKAFTVTMLDESAPFSLFENFGFRSGREADKFAGVKCLKAANGVPYLTENASGFVSGTVIETIDLGTHTLFVGQVEEKGLLSEIASLTYAYYQAHTKPRPKPAARAGWRCKICGYVYDGDNLPADFVCPLCKHGAADFEPIEPPKPLEPKKVWRCKVCGYIYEGEILPDNFTCPICERGGEEFEQIEIIEPGKAPKKAWRCKICNYVYEGEELPPDFICPTCKHGAADFEQIEM